MSTNLCNLNCRFCTLNTPKGHNYAKNYGIHITLQNFIFILEKVINYGIKNVDLTPYTSDIFLIPNIMSMLKYINKTNVHFEYVTNFLEIDDNRLSILNKFDNFENAISIYGWDAESYVECANRNSYKKFIANFKLLSNYPNLIKHTRIYMRNGTLESMPNNSEIKLLINKYISKGAVLEEAEVINRNWGGTIDLGEPMIDKQGVCTRIIHENGILPNGDLVLCGCWTAASDELKIGNVFENSLEELYSIKDNSQLSKILTSQHCNIYSNMCKNCNDFEKLKD